MDYLDYSNLTACGGDCSGCKKLSEGLCPGCIASDGCVPEWAESGRCRVHACTRDHGVRFCGLCREFPCKKLSDMVPWIPEPEMYFAELKSRFFNEADGFQIFPYSSEYRDDMIFMVLEAKNALGRVPRLNEDLLDVEKNYPGRFWLAVAGDRVVGCVGFTPIEGTDEAFLHRLFVKYNLKRRGIGSALLRTTESAMRRSGVAISRVHLGAPKEQWFESYKFYPKHGYTEYAPRYMAKRL